MSYQMRTIQKISKTRSGAVKHIYIPFLPSRTLEIVLQNEYVVIGARIDYHTGRYYWHREFSFKDRKDAKKKRDELYEFINIPDRTGLIMNAVFIVKRFRR